MKKILRMMKLLTVTSLVVAGLLLGTQATSHASMQLAVNDFSSPIYITDNGAGDLDPTVGAITYINHNYSGWDINVSTGLSKPHIGSATAPQLDLTGNVSGGNTVTGALQLGVMDTDFTAPGPTAFDVAAGGTTTGNTTVSFYYVQDPSNSGFPYGTVLGSSGPFGAPSFNGAATLAALGGLSSDYALYIVAEIALHGDATILTSFDASAAAVPLPPSVLLLGSGLLGLVGWRRFSKG